MPTFGDTTAGANDFPCTNDRAIASDFSCPESGTATQINVRFHSTGTAGTNAKALLYADSAGAPGALLVASGAVAIPSGGGDIAFAISNTAVSATTYWIGCVTDSFQAVFECDATGDLKRREAHTYASPADPWGADSGTSGSQLNAYVTYTTGGPAGHVCDFGSFPKDKLSRYT